ncbi:unnamed protein product [Ascophyllum nodosum]
MEFLSAASETVANADAIAAAAATLSARLPGAAASDSSGASSAGTSPRPNNNNDSEIEGEGEVPSTRFPEGNVSVAAVVAGLSGSAGASMMVGTGISPAARDAHAKLEKQAEEIRNGTHSKLLSEKEKQEEIMRRRLKSAKENCDLLMNNVDQLREAGLRDSDVQTKVALERTQEELLDDVHQRIRKSKVDGGLVSARRSASGIVPDTGDADKGGGAGLILVKKRRRLMPTQPFDKVTPEAVLAKAEARRIRTLTLSDIEMRRDFREIILDWRERASKYLSTFNNSHWTKVTVFPDSFRVRGVTFSKGDPVVVTSRVTGEEFHGEITVVKPKAVFLSLYGGVKTRIFVDHISTGRLTVARADARSVR